MQNEATKSLKLFTKSAILPLLLSITWGAVILCLSLISSPPDIPGVLGWDKLLHAGAYGLLTLLVAPVFFTYYRNRLRTYFLTGLVCILYGGMVEVLQLLANTGRTAEWWDLFADALGVAAACVVFRQGYGMYIKHADRVEHCDE